LTLVNPHFSETKLNFLSKDILQAARVRIYKTEYISCPGCGRTLFDLQKTIAEVKKAIDAEMMKHSPLGGEPERGALKIAVMGCIVNGPGEMADADYGYVGAGRGKVSLYRGKECVLKNIPQEEAVEQLLKLIESDRESSTK
jgi:(E)-4-hydroxy-3-methylbut-2-enyl-diphosphate synthase